PTQGQPFQISYAFNGVGGGPANQKLVVISNGHGTSNVLLAWDHSNIPICAVQYPGGPPVPVPADAPDVSRHYPLRHNQTFNALYCDGHVASLTLNDVTPPIFYAW